MQERMTEGPLVTVITLVYNAGKNIIGTLDSIKNQTYKNIQHVIIDDFSRDDSVSIIEKWIKDTGWQCLFIKNTSNKGICANLNFAIKELAKGKYCSIIGDDIMMPTKIEGDVVFLEKHPDYMFCYSKMSIFDIASGSETFMPFREVNNPFHDYLEAKNPVLPAPTLFYRTEVFEKVDYYDERYICEDFDMILKITYKYKVGFRDEYTIRYIVHPGSLSVAKKGRLYTDVLKILDEKWSFLPRYPFYRDRRHLNIFYLFAEESKKDAVKYLPHSLRFIFTRTFIKGLYVLLFRWPKSKVAV